MKNCVYRFINESNEIIYVGKAKNLKQRLNSHTHLPKECYEERKRIEYITFDTEEEMDFAERYFILKENPKYNTILSGKDFGLRSIDLDIKEWIVYSQDKTVFNTDRQNRRLDKSLALILHKLIELDIKHDMLIECEMYKDKETGTITDVFWEIRKLMNKYEKDGIKILKKIYKSMDEKALRWIIINRVDNIDDALQKELEHIEKKYFVICSNSIERHGYYKEEVYEGLDLEFVCTYDKEHFSWLHMFDGDFVINGLERYAIKPQIKNQLIDDIIANVHERLIEKYGCLKKEIMMLDAEVEYMKSFYPKYSYKKFNKPFIVYKVAKMSSEPE